MQLDVHEYGSLDGLAGRRPRWGAATGIGGRHVDPPMTSHGRAGSSDPALARLSAFPGSSLPHFRVDVNSPPRFSSIDINEFEGAVQAGGLEGGLVLFHPFRVHGGFLRHAERAPPAPAR